MSLRRWLATKIAPGWCRVLSTDEIDGATSKAADAASEAMALHNEEEIRRWQKQYTQKVAADHARIRDLEMEVRVAMEQAKKFGQIAAHLRDRLTKIELGKIQLIPDGVDEAKA